jgi:hypothetical protein
MYQKILKDLKKLYEQAQSGGNIATALSIKKLEFQIRERMKELSKDRPCKIPPLNELTLDDIRFFLHENGFS